MRKGLFVLLMVVSLPALAAPELSESDRQRLADGTTDGDDVLDQQDGFYVLLRHASRWRGDDFAGDAGAAVAPPPDYAFLKDKPADARGNVYLIEGWLAGSDRWPTHSNHDRDTFVRSGDPAWGDQLTRWMLVTEKGNADATVMVLFNDPNAKMMPPKPGDKVRVAARFHKLWRIPSSQGVPFTYPVFIGGAAGQVEQPSASTSASGPPSSLTVVLAGIVIAGGFLVVMRILMKKVATGGGGGHQVRDRLDEMRREREFSENHFDGEEDVDHLPDDPATALDVLRQKHGPD